MAFTDKMITAVRGDSRPEIAVLLAASAGRGQAAADSPQARPVDAERLFEVARFNKMLGWLPLGPASLPQGCASLAPRLLQAKLQTARMNQRAMQATAEVAAALHAAGLRHVVLKGPFQQMAVHDDPLRRPSGDVDLYVTPRDRRRAGRVLGELGFTAFEEDRALWWVPFLGEQHFRRDGDGIVIDLHHRLQQAGLPDWRGAESVLDRAETRDHGGTPIPVLSPPDGCLLMAVTLAKALLAHEPCGWAAADLSHWLARLTPAEHARLHRIAADARQDRTLALGISLTRACGYAVPDGHAAPLRGLPADPDLLCDLVLQPWQRDAEALRRRQLLRMLAAGRPHVLALEAARAALSERVRAMLERRAGKPSSP